MNLNVLWYDLLPTIPKFLVVMTYLELLSFLVTFNILINSLGIGITLIDFLVFGLSTIIWYLPFTFAEYCVLLIVSKPVLKSISSHIKASNSPNLIPVYKQITIPM